MKAVFTYCICPQYAYYDENLYLLRIYICFHSNSYQKSRMLKRIQQSCLFFGVLENSIGNESLKFGENVISSDMLRNDEVVPFHNPELIRKNFPEREGDYLKLPKVV